MHNCSICRVHALETRFVLWGRTEECMTPSGCCVRQLRAWGLVFFHDKNAVNQGWWRALVRGLQLAAACSVNCLQLSCYDQASILTFAFVWKHTCTSSDAVPTGCWTPTARKWQQGATKRPEDQDYDVMNHYWDLAPADVLQKRFPQLHNTLWRVEILLASAHRNVQPEVWTVVVGVGMRRQLIFHFSICINHIHRWFLVFEINGLILWRNAIGKRTSWSMNPDTKRHSTWHFRYDLTCKLWCQVCLSQAAWHRLTSEQHQLDCKGITTIHWRSVHQNVQRRRFQTANTLSQSAYKLLGCSVRFAQSYVSLLTDGGLHHARQSITVLLVAWNHKISTESSHTHFVWQQQQWQLQRGSLICTGPSWRDWASRLNFCDSKSMQQVTMNSWRSDSVPRRLWLLTSNVAVKMRWYVPDWNVQTTTLSSLAVILYQETVCNLT